MRFLNANEIAELLDVSVARVYVLARSEILPCVRLGRQIRFSEQALEQWIANGGQALPGGWRRDPSNQQPADDQ